DAQPQGERVAELGVVHVLHHHSGVVALDRAPARPADEAVNRRAGLGLVDRAVVGAQSPADLDDDGTLVAEAELELLARGRSHAVRTASESTISRSTL